MPKFSDLPLLDLATLDGTETIAVMKNGLLQAASIGALVTSIPAALPIIADAEINIDWSDAVDGAIARNIGQPDPTPNLFAFPTGPITDEVNDNDVVLTNFSAARTDPSGITNNATRMVFGKANEFFYLARFSNLTPAMPSGTIIGLRFRITGSPGTASGQQVRIFHGTTNTLINLDDLDWSEGAGNDAATTFEVEFTYTGGDVSIRSIDANNDIHVDRLQGYIGGLAAVPDWADEVHTGGRKAVAFSNSLTLDANGAADTTGHTSGLLAIGPAFPAARALTEYTVMEVRSADFDGDLGCVINYHPGDGGSSAEFLLQMDNESVYQGEINSGQGTNTRSQMAANMDGQGVFVCGYSRSATQRAVYIEGAPLFIEDVDFEGIETSRWCLGSFSNSNLADMRSFRAPGKHVRFLMWPRRLSHEEFAIAAKLVRDQAASRGHDIAKTYAPIAFSGDSNGQRGTGDFTQQVTANDYFAPQPNMIMANSSVGGQGLQDLERHAEVGGVDEALPDGTITDNGRFRSKDLPCLLGWARMGFRPLFGMFATTNDGPRILRDGVQTYMDQYEVVAQEALDADPNIGLLLEEPKPQNATRAGWLSWESDRAAIMVRQAAIVAANPGRAFLCTFGSSTTIGDPANFRPYYDPADDVHLLPAGDDEATVIMAADYSAARSAMGLTV